MHLPRRHFLRLASLSVGSLALARPAFAAGSANVLSVADLPVGSAPPTLPLPHFPSRLHAWVWRNWGLRSLERLAQVVQARPADLKRLGHAMGLSGPPRVSRDFERRSALTVIRRNWHLLPYEQLLVLLGWSADELAFALREDDFLYIKLGSLKPKCDPILYTPPTAQTRAQEEAIAQVVRTFLPSRFGQPEEPLFQFVSDLTTPLTSEVLTASTAPAASRFNPRFAYSYFALYGDPLLDETVDPYPEGYLARLARSGVDGVWLQAVLYKLTPFPWDPSLSTAWERRLVALQRLVARARRQGLGVWLYLNEPRAMPLAFHHSHPGLQGVTEGDYASLCTSVPAVRDYLRRALATVVSRVPDLAGFFTISGSENLTHCWSHHGGAQCPGCRERGPAEVIADLHRALAEGIAAARPTVAAGSAVPPGVGPRLIAWDWGWADDWTPGIIERLPAEAALMSVSEWDLPIERGGTKTTVGEYSISSVGPGPRARRHWDLARKRGLKTMAKIQTGNTWELSAVPYIPAVALVAQHAAHLCDSGVSGLMLGWTLGGYPSSPNLEAVTAMGRTPPGQPAPSVATVLQQVAERRFGSALAPAVVRAWEGFSQAFREFPFHGGLVYNAPVQCGPANLLWEQPTGYRASMVGFPYDDLDAWRQVYPPEVYIGQFEKVADGFDAALARLEAEVSALGRGLKLSRARAQALERERSVARAAALHFRSAALQARFVLARQQLGKAASSAEAVPLLAQVESLLRTELDLARQLHALQSHDSRLGFEASNQYFYVPMDLGEKVLNCQDLLTRWLPGERKRWRG